MKNFPEHYKELSTWMAKLGVAIPQTMKGFTELHKASITPGALDSKTKELIVLGIAITVRCEGVLRFTPMTHYTLEQVKKKWLKPCQWLCL